MDAAHVLTGAGEQVIAAAPKWPAIPGIETGHWNVLAAVAVAEAGARARPESSGSLDPDRDELHPALVFAVEHDLRDLVVPALGFTQDVQDRLHGAAHVDQLLVHGDLGGLGGPREIPVHR
ncbi:hypothetical protein [Kribbella sp. VKM Ac-2568]|uniref:hypothetical protein n=1 Tax=Kribbella sp. VKM Ac-2568 TaxID=2512219 RepID=UPI0010494642|nr:hypothetical protein [Kribbella sp. VKM Ac-2568]